MMNEREVPFERVVFESKKTNGSLESLDVSSLIIKNLFWQEKDVREKREPLGIIQFHSGATSYANYYSNDDLDPTVLDFYEYLFTTVDYSEISLRSDTEKLARMTFEGNHHRDDRHISELEDVEGVYWELESLFVNVFYNDNDETLIIFGTPEGVVQNKDIVEGIFSDFVSELKP